MEWRKIEGFENYSVSDTGEIRNDLTGKKLKSFVSSTGYKISHLSANGIKKTVKLHRIIAKAFIPNPNNKKCVNHINGNKQDNSLNNLEWCTHSENNIHSYKMLGRKSYNAIEAMTIKKMKPVICIETGKLYKSVKDAITATGILNISSCLTGKRNTAGGFHWGYVN